MDTKRRYIKVKQMGGNNTSKTSAQIRKEVNKEINEVLKSLKFDFNY